MLGARVLAYLEFTYRSGRPQNAGPSTTWLDADLASSRNSGGKADATRIRPTTKFLSAGQLLSVTSDGNVTDYQVAERHLFHLSSNESRHVLQLSTVTGECNRHGKIASTKKGGRR